MFNIKIDNSLLKETFFDEVYINLKERIENFANENNIQIFEAVERFYSAPT